MRSYLGDHAPAARMANLCSAALAQHASLSALKDAHSPGWVRADRVKAHVRQVGLIALGDQQLDLSALAQLVELSQTRAIAEALQLLHQVMRPLRKHGSICTLVTLQTACRHRRRVCCPAFRVFEILLSPLPCLGVVLPFLVDTEAAACRAGSHRHRSVYCAERSLMTFFVPWQWVSSGGGSARRWTLAQLLDRLETAVDEQARA